MPTYRVIARRSITLVQEIAVSVEAHAAYAARFDALDRIKAMPLDLAETSSVVTIKRDVQTRVNETEEEKP